MIDELVVKMLTQAAWEVQKQAYAPYSHFYVGAAVLGDNGIVYKGCNVENSSYGLSCCAERNAIFHGVAEGCRKFEAIAIAGSADYTMPCGACRQVIAEFSIPYVITVGTDQSYRIMAAQDLLPSAFQLTESI